MAWRFGLPSSRPGLALALALVSFVAVAAAERTGVLVPLDLWVYDGMQSLMAREPIPPPAVALVVIDEADIQRFGHPLRDRELLEALDTILEAAPRAVGVDLYRDMPVPRADQGGPRDPTPDYERLGDRILADPRVVMVFRQPDALGPGAPPPAFLESERGAFQLGFSDLPLDPSGRVRRGLLYLWDDDVPRYSLALQLAARFLAADGIQSEAAPEDPDLLKLGPTVVTRFLGDDGPYVGADAGGYQFLLDFRHGPISFPTYRVGDVLDGRVDPADLTDRVVLVGTTSASVKDSFRTWLDAESGRGGTYGVEIHARAIDQLIRFARGEAAPLRSLGPLLTSVYLLLLAGLGAVIGLQNRSLLLQAALGLLVGSAVILTAWFAFLSSLWVPLVAPLLAAGLSGLGVSVVLAVVERRERRALAGLFSRFQGKAIAEEIWRRRNEFMENGRPVSQRITLTALMSDLEGYTSASEKMEPQELMTWANEYMAAMAELVQDFGGEVDDYAGDGIKANFGFPMPSRTEEEVTDWAVAAVRCALAMGARMDALNEDWQARGLPTGRCRVGLFTGPAVAGVIGGSESMRYTSVGDTINTAARLEGFDKDAFKAESSRVSFRVLIGERTRGLIGDRFEVEALGAHPLKGKGQPVPIYRVRAERDRQPDD